ncbi:MAG TPA: HlyD family efflux transporter periplasmic adaptor subunit, partial [Kofleriaceae bacterium]
VVELEERLLGFEVGGRVTHLGVERGAEVKPDEVLATLDDTLAQTARAGRQAEAEAAKARADLVGAGSRVEDIRALEAQLRAAEATNTNAQLNVARDRKLVASGALPRQALDDSETRAQSASSTVLALRQQLRELRAGARSQELAGARAQATAADVAVRLEGERVARYQLKAPANGVVLDVHVEAGEVVAAGAPVVTVADVSRPYVDVFVKQAELADLDVGDRAMVHSDSLPLPVPGVVEDVGRRTEFTPRYLYSERERGTLVVRVRIRIEDRARLLHAGVPAFVTIDRGAARAAQPGAKP